MKGLFKVNSSNAVKAGLRLALINSALLFSVGIVTTVLFFIVTMINKIGFPLPQPLALILILFGIPYYVFFYNYGKQYGMLIIDRSFIKGLIVGVLGQLPGMAIRFVLNNPGLLLINPSDWEKLFRILNIFITVFILVVPLICALGSLDRENNYQKKTKSM